MADPQWKDLLLASRRPLSSHIDDLGIALRLSRSEELQNRRDTPNIPQIQRHEILKATSAIIMPLLGRAKKKLAAETGSRALRTDAAQSNICAYMSWIALAGLLVNFFFRLASGRFSRRIAPAPHRSERGYRGKQGRGLRVLKVRGI